MCLDAQIELQKAIKYWEDATCVTFKKRTNEYHYINITQIGGEDGGYTITINFLVSHAYKLKVRNFY